MAVSLNQIAAVRIPGATTSSAKKPYTTVGIPARISRIGLIQARARGEAYSERKIAEKRPIGAATSMAISAIMKVPKNRGSAPNSASVCAFHRVPVRKSQADTFWKNRRLS